MNFIQLCLIFLSTVSIFASEIDQSAQSPIDDVTINQKEQVHESQGIDEQNKLAQEEKQGTETKQQRQFWLMHHFEQHHEDQKSTEGVAKIVASAVVDQSATKANGDTTANVASTAINDDLVVAVASPSGTVAIRRKDEKLVTPTSLQTDLFEFIDLVPVDEVNELKVRYYVSDPQVRKAYDYLQNYDYSFVNDKLGNMVEIQSAINFLTLKGLNITELWQAIIEKFGPPNNSMTEGDVHSTNTGGFYALLDNILDEIPQEEVVTLFFDKMDSSANFSALLEWIGTNDFKNLLNILRYDKDVQRFVFGLRDNGIDVVSIYKLFRNYFGFGNR